MTILLKYNNSHFIYVERDSSINKDKLLTIRFYDNNRQELYKEVERLWPFPFVKKYHEYKI